MSSTAIPLPLNLFVGLKLVPLHTGRVGNAVITAIQDDSFTVVTDFGNEMKFTESELRGLFEWTEMQAEHVKLYQQVIGEPFNFEDELRERFQVQLELIKEQLNKLNNKPA